jgi:hypothetical protein
VSSTRGRDLSTPLVTVVLTSVDDARAGLASAINTAIARIGSLMAVAVLPGVVGLRTGDPVAAFTASFRHAQLLTAAICATAAPIALVTLRRHADPESQTAAP